MSQQFAGAFVTSSDRRPLQWVLLGTVVLPLLAVYYMYLLYVELTLRRVALPALVSLV